MNMAVILVVIASGTTLFTFVLGCVLAYHWLRFAMDRFATILAISVFTALSVMLLITLFGAAAYTI